MIIDIQQKELQQLLYIPIITSRLNTIGVQTAPVRRKIRRIESSNHAKDQNFGPHSNYFARHAGKSNHRNLFRPLEDGIKCP